MKKETKKRHQTATRRNKEPEGVDLIVEGLWRNYVSKLKPKEQENATQKINAFFRWFTNGDANKAQPEGSVKIFNEIMKVQRQLNKKKGEKKA